MVRLLKVGKKHPYYFSNSKSNKMELQIGTHFEYVYWNQEAICGFAKIIGSITNRHDQKAGEKFFIPSKGTFLVDSNGIIWANLGQGIQCTDSKIRVVQP